MMCVTDAGAERAPVGGHYAGCPPSGDFYPRDICLRQHLPAVILDARDEGVGERPAATDGYAETVSLEEA